MKVTCNVIRDILPLYAENLASEDTAALVDDHLCCCDSCMRELGILKRIQIVPLERDVDGLKKVRKTIYIRKIVAVLTAVMLVFSLYSCINMLMNATIYPDAEDIVESVDALEDGTIRIRWKNVVTSTGSLGIEITENGAESLNFGIICSTSLRNILFPKEPAHHRDIPVELRDVVSEEEWGASTWQLEGGASSWNIWFCNAKDGTGETLLWDAGHPYPENAFQDVNYHILWYFLLLICFTAVFALVSRKKILPKVMRGVSTAFGCIAFCVIVVTAGQFMELWGEFTICFVNSLVLAIPVFLTAMGCWQLHDWSRQDKGF